MFYFPPFVLSDCQLTIVRATGIFTRVSSYFSNLAAIWSIEKGKTYEFPSQKDFKPVKVICPFKYTRTYQYQTSLGLQ